MARIRTIKPEFWQHEDLSCLPEATHMLAASLLNYADDEGYFNANPRLIQAQCFPLREPSVSIHDSLKGLSEIGWIRLGIGSDGKTYGHIVKFKEHQRINRPTESKISSLEIFWEDSQTTHTQLSERSHPERKGKERKGKDSPSGAASAEFDFSSDEITEKQVFDYGKTVLGKSAGGQITKLRKQYRFDDRSVMDVLRQAAEKSEPSEWIGAVLRGDENTRTPEHELLPPEIYRNVL